MHAESFSVYGIPKMWHAMNREGFHIGRDKTARLMKLAGVSGRRRGRTPVTTISPKTPDHRPYLVQRGFRAQAPGRLWVADITYVRTLSGFAYTALAESGIRPNVGTVGDSYDNAQAETVNGLFKAELIHAQGPWTSVGEVELATLRWVLWWNTKRLHEALDYATPQEVETEYYLTQPVSTGP